MTVLVDTPVPVTNIPMPVDLARVPATELPEGLSSLNGIRDAVVASASTTTVADDPFKLSNRFAYTPRRLKVFTIGAGFSGLLMAHKFQHRFPEMRDIVDHTIFEARSDVGGTWLANHYPGVQCDVPAHIYVSNPSVARLLLLAAVVLSTAPRRFDYADTYYRHFLSTQTRTGPGSTRVGLIS